MKIAIISTFFGNTGGAEVSSSLLADALSKDNSVFIITTKKSKSSHKLYSLGLVIFPNILINIGTPCLDFFMKRKIFKILKEEKPDIVHIQDFSILNATLSVTKKLGIKTVLTVRDTRHTCNLVCNTKEFRTDCQKYVYKKCLRKMLDKQGNAWLTNIVYPFFSRSNKNNRKNIFKVDKLISVSDFVKNEISKRGIQKKNINTIFVPKPNWNYVQPTKKNKVILFSAGALVEGKGFVELIKEFKLAYDKYPNLELHIAGEGSYKKVIIDYIEKLNLDNSVILLGKISYEKMKNEFINSDIVMMPSIWFESLSRIIFEAFTIGRPVISTNSGGSSELVKNGKTGYVTNEFSKYILILANDENLRIKLGKNARKLIEKEANMEKIYKAHLSLYNQLVGGKK